MASSWITCKISDVAEVVGGGTPSTKNAAYYGGDISWITPKDLSGYTEQYICKGERNITPLGLEKSSAKLLPKGAILFSSRAPIGYVAIAENPLSTNQGFKSIVPKDGKLDSLFGYYLMKYYASEIERHASGSTFKEVSGSVVKNFDIKLPSCISMQKSIASILSSVDEKIANNTAMNQTLEKIAQRIFKSWFIDFDPVKANKEGVAFDGLSPEIQALFPSEFEESELGMIPKGWKVSSIGDEVKTVGGATPSTKNNEFWEGGEFLWTTPKDLSGQTAKILFDTTRKITNAGLKKISSGLLPVSTVLMSSRAPVGYLAIAKEKMAINQGYIAMICDRHLGSYFMLLWLDFNMESIKKRAGGTTFSEISKKAFRPIPILVSNQTILKKFESQINPIFERIELNARQNVTLEKVRDRLLPKLISGQITVGEAQKELAEAI